MYSFALNKSLLLMFSRWSQKRHISWKTILTMNKYLFCSVKDYIFVFWFWLMVLPCFGAIEVQFEIQNFAEKYILSENRDYAKEIFNMSKDAFLLLFCNKLIFSLWEGLRNRAGYVWIQSRIVCRSFPLCSTILIKGWKSVFILEGFGGTLIIQSMKLSSRFIEI